MTICGKPTHSHQVLTNLAFSMPMCRSCFRSIDYREPEPEVIWTATWIETGKLPEEPIRTVRDCSEFEGIRLVVFHDRAMTRMWVTRLHEITQFNPHNSIKDHLDTTKMWIDSKYYRVVKLDSYIKDVLCLEKAGS